MNKQIKNNLLNNNNISLELLIKEINKFNKKDKLFFSDIYVQEQYKEYWKLENNIIQKISFSYDQGIGSRIISGEFAGFSFSNEISKNAIKKTLYEANHISKFNKNNIDKNNKEYLIKNSHNNIYSKNNPLDSISEQDKKNILYNINRYARSMDNSIINVNSTLYGENNTILVVNSSNEISYDIRPIVKLSISITIKNKNKKEKGIFIISGRNGYNDFLNTEKLKKYIEKALLRAKNKLHAIDAPIGNMPVVLGAGWSGILLHESIGHGLEGDGIRKKSSAFYNLKGEKIASSICNVVDNGTLLNSIGSLNVDDEGEQTKNNILIENGILKSFMFDKHNALLMNQKSTGNGRRESYAHIPLPRMTNTYMLPGKYDPKEIIESVKYGIYSNNFSGGQVDISSGNFVFTSNESYIIKNGRITDPIKDITIIGDGPSVLKKISMIGNNLTIDDNGICGKDGQNVNVGVGQPTIKVDSLTIGGTK